MFSGFVAADFDCYLPHKWKSNVFNRERLEVKQKLLGLAREAGGALTAADGSPLFIESSVEHPALWNHKQVEAQSIYFSRNEAARKELDGIIDRQKPIASLLDDPTPQRNHLFLAVTLTHEGLELSLKLHPDARVDRQNLERKIEDHFECDRLLGLLSDLSAGYRIGITPSLRPLTEITSVDALRTIVAELPPASGAGPVSLPGQVPVPHLFYVGRLLPRDGAGGDAATVARWAADGLAELLPIFRFIAWSRDNDYVSMRQVLDKEKTVKRQKGLGKNDTVRIVRGMLAGKTGVVQEVDAKGQLKVLVGKLTIKVDAADVEK
jgi:transcription antitermination factor NusG